jgi:hypothetical protein
MPSTRQYDSAPRGFKRRRQASDAEAAVADLPPARQSAAARRRLLVEVF